MKKVIKSLLLAIFALTLFVSCEGLGGLSGTYVPKKGNAAESMPYSKFVFSGGKVKMYMGAMGMSLANYEYRYSVNGNKVSVEGGIPGVNAGGIEFTYDKDKDELSLFNDGTFGAGVEGVVWVNEKNKGKSGSPNESANNTQKPNDGETVMPTPEPSKEIEEKGTLDKIGDFFFKNLLPKSGEGESKEDNNSNSIKTGQLVFLTHGLSDKVTCFETTAATLKKDKNYISLGYVTMGRDDRTKGKYYNDELKEYIGNETDLPKIIDKLASEGLTILVRTEFSAGNLSFDKQLEEMRTMVGDFDNHHVENVVFIGHSMGGLASINYAIDFAGKYKSKKVKIITVDTPYHPNDWSSIAWINNNIKNTAEDTKKRSQILVQKLGAASIEAVAAAINELYGEPIGEAHRDLGGHSTELENLKNKWNNNQYSNIKRYAIAVSMYAKWDENDKKHTEKNWEDKGDGVVDIPSQEGIDWTNVIKTTLFGYEKGHTTPLGDLQEKYHPYHHKRVTQNAKVIQQIKEFIEWQ